MVKKEEESLPLHKRIGCCQDITRFPSPPTRIVPFFRKYASVTASQQLYIHCCQRTAICHHQRGARLVHVHILVVMTWFVCKQKSTVSSHVCDEYTLYECLGLKQISTSNELLFKMNVAKVILHLCLHFLLVFC